VDIDISKIKYKVTNNIPEKAHLEEDLRPFIELLIYVLKNRRFFV